MGDTGGIGKRDGGGNADHQPVGNWRQHDCRFNSREPWYDHDRIAWECGRRTELWRREFISGCNRESSRNQSE